MNQQTPERLGAQQALGRARRTRITDRHASSHRALILRVRDQSRRIENRPPRGDKIIDDFLRSRIPEAPGRSTAWPPFFFDTKGEKTSTQYRGSALGRLLEATLEIGIDVARDRILNL